MDEASNVKESGTKIMIDEQDDSLTKQSLRFEFNASNNQSEYVALIVGMSIALEVRASTLKSKRDLSMW